jgi:hypothetical protein
MKNENGLEHNFFEQDNLPHPLVKSKEATPPHEVLTPEEIETIKS